jgi:hypothetical protein
LVQDNTDQIVAALDADLGKPMQEALSQEITMTLQDIINVAKNVSTQCLPDSDLRSMIGPKMNMSRSTLPSSLINVESGRNPLESFSSWVHGTFQCGVPYVQSSVSWLQATPLSSKYLSLPSNY